MSEVYEVDSIDQLRDLIDTEEQLVIKFTAPSWCAPCRAFAPHFAKAAESTSFDSHARTTFVSVDIDKVPDADVVYGIRSVPTVMLYQDGKYVRNLQERTAPKLIAEIRS